MTKQNEHEGYSMTSTITEATSTTQFNVGDRVRVSTTTMESGYEGFIEEIPALNGDDCQVDIDTPYEVSLSYRFEQLTKIEDEIEDMDEDEETFKSVQQTTKYEVGDIMVIDITGPKVEQFQDWQGLRFPLAETSTVIDMLFLANGKIDMRPDNIDSDFFWDEKWLRPFDPATDFRAGDIVEAARYSLEGAPAKGVVTQPHLLMGGDIEIDWISGPPALVAYGPIGASRKYLKLAGVSVPRPEVEPEPLKVGDRVKVIDNVGDSHAVLDGLGVVTAVEGDLLTVLQDNGTKTAMFDFRFERSDEPEQPIRSDFDFEAGQEIGSSDVLADLPLGTVLVRGDDMISPIVKLGQGRFGRLNRYALMSSDGRGLLAHDETDFVRAAADGPSALLIAYVPSESL